jgi:hypothetical protein
MMRTQAVPWEGVASVMVVIAAAMLFGLSETPSEGFRVTLVVAVVASLVGSIFATWRHSRWWFALTGIALLLLMTLIGARALWGADAIVGKAG